MTAAFPPSAVIIPLIGLIPRSDCRFYDASSKVIPTELYIHFALKRVTADGMKLGLPAIRYLWIRPVRSAARIQGVGSAAVIDTRTLYAVPLRAI